MDRGLTTEGLDRLSAAAARHVGDDRVPGLVALVARGEAVHVEAHGTLSVGGAPVQRDSLFRIASTTKPIAAAATLALADEGLIGLDEPVDRLLPELAGRRVLTAMDGPLDDTVAASRAITTRDLLTFTLGFGMVTEMFTAPRPWPVVVAANELRLQTFGPPDPSVQPDPDTWIAGLGSLPLMAQPGQRWMYNTGALVLGVLLARAADQPLAEVLRGRIFEPLGMRDTAFWATRTDRLATSYWSAPPTLPATPPLPALPDGPASPALPALPAPPAPGGLAVYDPPDGAWSLPPAFGDAAAGLLSTVDDLLAFARMLLRGGDGVLSAQAARAMITDQLTAEQKAHGGLGDGFFDGRSWSFCQAVHESGAFGWDGGLGTSWLVDPHQDLTVIVLTQRMFDGPGTPQVHRDIQAAAYAALG